MTSNRPDLSERETASPTNPSEATTRPSAFWLPVGAALPAIALLALGWQRRWMADDAYIDLRVVRNILSGYGPVFNVGERVEAYTNPLWVGILSVCGWLGMSLPYSAVILGLLFSAGGLIAAEGASLRLWRTWAVLTGSLHERARISVELSDRRALVPLGAITFIAVPAVWDFATSGLETGLTFGWLGVSFGLLVMAAGKSASPVSPIEAPRRPVSFPAFLLTAVVVGLGPLIRPDLALWSVCFLAVMLWGYVVSSRRRQVASWPGAMALTGAAIALPLAYEIFRMAYFAALLPNTAYAKDAGGAYWSQGIKYLWDFAGTYYVFIPILVMMLLAAGPIVRLLKASGHQRLIAAVWFAPIAGALLDTFYVVRVGGDFMHARFLLPAFFGCLMPVMFVPVPVPRLQPRRPRVVRVRWSSFSLSAGVALVLVWAAVCVAWLRPTYSATPAKDGISNERAFYAHAADNSHPITPSDYAKLPFAEDGVWIHSLVEAQLNQQRQASTTPAAKSTKGRPGLVLINGIEPNQVTMSADLPSSIALAAVRSALGLVSYIAGPRAFIVDRFGLADPIGSRLEVKTRGRPGHEKDLSNAWALARLADPSSPAAQTPAVKAAEAALSCGAPKRLLQAIHQPLTLQRLVDNFGVAIELRHLSIPENPVQAEAKFCRSS